MTIEERSQIILASILALLPAPPSEFDYDYALAVVVAQVEAELEDWEPKHAPPNEALIKAFARYKEEVWDKR